jgi:hypothetical protein
MSKARLSLPASAHDSKSETCPTATPADITLDCLNSMLHSVKSKLVSKALSGTKGSKERKNAWSAVIIGLQTTLRIVNETTASAGVPGLQSGIGSLILVLDVIKVRRNQLYLFVPLCHT